MNNHFKLLAGLHFENGKRFNKGDTVVSPQDLTHLFPEKFKRIEAEDEDAEPELESEPVPVHETDPIRKGRRVPVRA